MPRRKYIDALIDLLLESDIQRPFTARQAYDWIVNTPPKREGKTRSAVPKSAMALSKKLGASKRIVVVNLKYRNHTEYVSESGGAVRQYDFAWLISG